MTRVRVPQNTFSGGEIDPLLLARDDFQRFKTGLSACRGFLPLRQGAFTRAPGSVHAGYTADNFRARRIPFEFAQDDAVELEFTFGRMRVWRYGELVLKDGSPYEVATPWLLADIETLDTAQDGDVIYVVDGTHPMHKISRRALDDWTVEPVDFKTGPFQVQNLDEWKTIQCDGATGNIGLSGAGGIFQANHVGVSFLIRPTDFSNVPLWVGNDPDATNGSLVTYDDRIYRLVEGDNSGVNPPTHDNGIRRTDASKGTKYEFVSTLEGVLRITRVDGPNAARAQVLREIPQPCIDDPTYRWSEAAWSERQGYPRAVTLYERRLFAASTRSEPRTLWASTQGELEDYLPGVDADASFAYELDSDGRKNRILWLQRGRRGLYMGALGEVWRAFSSSPGEAIGPTTFDTDLVATDGAADTPPILAYGDPIYITRDKARVARIQYSFEEDGSRPLELSLPSQHLGRTMGFAQIVWQSAPLRTAWIRTDVGDLVAMVYDPDQDVLGWAPVPVAGGFVEDLCVSPSADGTRDVVSMVVRRVINGSVTRHVEILREDIALYCATIWAALPVDRISAPHLRGERIHAYTDEGAFEDLTVSATSGFVDIGSPVSSAVLGIFDASAYVDTLPLVAPARDGDARGRPQRLHGASIRLHETAAGTVRVVERDADGEPRSGQARDLVARRALSSGVRPVSALIDTGLTSGHCVDIRMRFRPKSGAPMTILAVTCDVEEVGA